MSGSRSRTNARKSKGKNKSGEPASQEASAEAENKTSFAILDCKAGTSKRRKEVGVEAGNPKKSAKTSSSQAVPTHQLVVALRNLTEQQNTELLHEESLALEERDNPYLDFYKSKQTSAPSDLDRIFHPSLDEDRRAELFSRVDSDVAEKFAWAIPDERALTAIKHFGPIVEMGAGDGYWARLLAKRGVDVIAFDIGSSLQYLADTEEIAVKAVVTEKASKKGSKNVKKKRKLAQESAQRKKTWFPVLHGNPKILQEFSDRTLLLCYPDDFELSEDSMAYTALMNYRGDTVIHIGELHPHTHCLPGSWGRTSGEEFQAYLASVFHKILQLDLPCWEGSIDTLTVWKRSQVSLFDDHMYRYIPKEEALKQDLACPSTAHLLEHC